MYLIHGFVLLHFFQEMHSTSCIQVAKSKRFQYRVGARPWSRGWWILKLGDLGRALVTTTAGTVATLADVVVELHGMSIGAMMSASAVAVHLAGEEQCWSLASLFAALA